MEGPGQSWWYDLTVEEGSPLGARRVGSDLSLFLGFLHSPNPMRIILCLGFPFLKMDFSAISMLITVKEGLGVTGAMFRLSQCFLDNQQMHLKGGICSVRDG